jgi:hypothetical protein
VDEALTRVQACATLRRHRQPTPLEPWLKRATNRTLEAMRRVATGLDADDAAVNAGVPRPWRTGPVEGHSNRLKRLKRQLFGRARLERWGRRRVRPPAAEQERSQPGAGAASSRGSNRAWRETMPGEREGRRRRRLDLVDDDGLIV